ncbi:MAG: dUTP diphosphatase [Candidatus Aenigmarchaeota archaeon]|nr:dUTP diphosphatase [Candidatus Aenigmarchaeota archaeon]
MKVNIKRIDGSLPLPVYETAGSVGFDIVCRQDTTIEPKSVGRVPGNVIVAVPDGYVLVVALRSSTPKKKQLLCPHGIGIIDNDYCGPDDEVMVQVYNFSEQSVTVARGEKIAQGIFVKVDNAEWGEVESVSEKSRGGFGSTDSK